MKTIEFKSPEQEGLYNAILAIQPTWAEIPLPDHVIQSQFDRKLVVKGFLDAPKDKFNNEMLNIFVGQILTFKDSGEVYKEIPMKTWEIFEHNQEFVGKADGTIEMFYEITTEMQYDEEGNELGEIEISRIEIPMKVPSIKLIKFYLHTKSIHLVDIFQKFMSMYAELYVKEINDI